jgi:acetyl-CoA synthetase
LSRRAELTSWSEWAPVLIVSDLPKTRSGKILRRLLRKIAAGEGDQLGDLSTCADPSVIEDIKAKFASMPKK